MDDNNIGSVDEQSRARAILDTLSNIENVTTVPDFEYLEIEEDEDEDEENLAEIKETQKYVEILKPVREKKERIPQKPPKPISLLEYKAPEDSLIVMIRDPRNEESSRGLFIDSSFKDDTLRMLFDKNLNVVPSSYTDVYSNEVVPENLFQNFSDVTTISSSEVTDFFVIRKSAFFESKGKNFRIIHKQGASYAEILQIRESYVRRFEMMEKYAEIMRNIIGSVFSEENYDIFFGFYSRIPLFETEKGAVLFKIALKYNDVVIENSIEMSKYLGTIVTFLTGIIFDNQIGIIRELKGVRLTYNYKDLVSDYAHSHLPSLALKEVRKFCLGTEDNIFYSFTQYLHVADTGYAKMSELELESLLFSIEDYLGWESLEGGPYHRMEAVNLFGKPLPKYHYQGIKFRKSRMRLGVKDKSDLLTLLFNNREEFKSCFELVEYHKGYRFICNHDEFLEKASLLINRNVLRKKLGTHMYNSWEKSFTEIDFEGTDGKLEKIVAVVERKQRDLPKIYMNGQIIVPTVEKSDDEQEQFDNATLTCHPVVLTRIANAITRLLNKQLKSNEYKKK